MSDIELGVIESFVVANLDENFLDRPFRTRPQDVQLILRQTDLQMKCCCFVFVVAAIMFTAIGIVAVVVVAVGGDRVTQKRTP